MELPRSPRLPVQCAIQYSGDATVGKGTVLNLSVDGFGIDGSQPIPRETRLSLIVFLSHGEEPIEVERAIVRRSRGSRFGLKSVRMGGDDWQRLRRLAGEKPTDEGRATVTS